MPRMESARREIALPDAAATEALGAALGRLLSAGALLALRGELGAGKTTLARGLIRALAGETEVVSPTFTLVQTYEAPDFEIWHADLYRIEDDTEIDELGLEEAFESAACIVEWPDRLGPRLPAARLDVTLSFEEGGGRRAALAAHGDNWARRLDAL